MRIILCIHLYIVFLTAILFFMGWFGGCGFWGLFRIKGIKASNIRGIGIITHHTYTPEEMKVWREEFDKGLVKQKNRELKEKRKKKQLFWRGICLSLFLGTLRFLVSVYMNIDLFISSWVSTSMRKLLVFCGVSVILFFESIGAFGIYLGFWNSIISTLQLLAACYMIHEKLHEKEKEKDEKEKEKHEEEKESPNIEALKFVLMLCLCLTFLLWVCLIAGALWNTTRKKLGLSPYMICIILAIFAVNFIFDD